MGDFHTLMNQLDVTYDELFDVSTKMIAYKYFTWLEHSAVIN